MTSKELLTSLLRIKLDAAIDRSNRIIVIVSDHSAKKTLLEVLDQVRQIDPTAKAVDRNKFRPLYEIQIQGHTVTLVAEKFKAPVITRDTTEYIKNLIDVTIMSLGSCSLLITGVNRTKRIDNINNVNNVSVSVEQGVKYLWVNSTSVQILSNLEPYLRFSPPKEFIDRLKSKIKSTGFKYVDYKGKFRESTNATVTDALAKNLMRDVTAIKFRGFHYDPKIGIEIKFDWVSLTPTDLPSNLKLVYSIEKGKSVEEGFIQSSSKSLNFKKMV
jgi:hypothetical protein